jgi:hypothetical protein
METGNDIVERFCRTPRDELFIFADLELGLACRQRNNEKRDGLMNVGSLERLCARSERTMRGDLEADEEFRGHFAERRLRDLSLHIKGLYDQAAADGFPFWGIR